ncbi:hypothetical protein CYMTET_32829 [Cymbomonas tetramitiformis]|uniref:Uncharacterized protein n=1 Tax=Cymbomonas tetramitiformis TaxID=36881 RepID=A0AAE0FE20_9CHLO|nr:hypothetical protein CYMTET_32829 [Cymbomonas tetramitiformis]
MPRFGYAGTNTEHAHRHMAARVVSCGNNNVDEGSGWSQVGASDEESETLAFSQRSSFDSLDVAALADGLKVVKRTSSAGTPERLAPESVSQSPTESSAGKLDGQREDFTALVDDLGHALGPPSQSPVPIITHGMTAPPMATQLSHMHNSSTEASPPVSSMAHRGYMSMDVSSYSRGHGARSPPEWTAIAPSVKPAGLPPVAPHMRHMVAGPSPFRQSPSGLHPMYPVQLEERLRAQASATSTPHLTGVAGAWNRLELTPESPDESSGNTSPLSTESTPLANFYHPPTTDISTLPKDGLQAARSGWQAGKRAASMEVRSPTYSRGYPGW